MGEPFTVVITDHRFKHTEQEREIIEAAGGALTVAQCATETDLAEAAAEADGLLVQFAPVTRAVIQQLKRCNILVRYGIGVDNVDLEAAANAVITVCNVPDYCTDEVADHTITMALALARQLPALDRRTRGGTWKLVPDDPMPAFRDMTFATLGFGRIAQAVQVRAGIFGFRRIAHDPLAPADAFDRIGVASVPMDDLLAQADILSLNAPLTENTRHIIRAETLAGMKPTAILINTARGPLVDTRALADALNRGVIAAAGLDVFESEPIESDHPLLSCPRALLTPHISYYSESSITRLQRLAAEEMARFIRNENVKNPVH